MLIRMRDKNTSGLDYRSYHAKSVVDWTIGLVHDQLIGASDQDRHSVTISLDSGALDDFGVVAEAYFLNKLAGSELFGRQLVNMGHRDASYGFANEFNLVALDVLDDHYSFFGQKVQRQVGDGIPQDGLLHQENIGSRLHNLIDQSRDVLAFFLHDSI